MGMVVSMVMTVNDHPARPAQGPQTDPDQHKPDQHLSPPREPGDIQHAPGHDPQGPEQPDADAVP